VANSQGSGRRVALGSSALTKTSQWLRLHWLQLYHPLDDGMSQSKLMSRVPEHDLGGTEVVRENSHTLINLNRADQLPS